MAPLNYKPINKVTINHHRHPVPLARHPVLDTGSRSTRSVQSPKHTADSTVKPRNNTKQSQTKTQQKAFTLIEVLIALVILAIALLAIVKVMGDSIRGLEAVKERTIAHWIANDTINNAQLGLISSPTPDSPEQSSTTMLNNTWYVNVSAKETANKYSQQVKVTMSLKQDAKPLWTEYGFIGVGS